MESLFGKQFKELDLPDIKAFLATAGDEGLTWEAKGDLQEHRWLIYPRFMESRF